MSGDELGRGISLENHKGRIIIVGDLHGCFMEAWRLLEKANVTADDMVIFAGDLVDRGPDNEECVELAMQHHAILGNHEEKHLQHEEHCQRTGKLPDNIPPSHVATRNQLSPRHYDYFRALPHFIRLPQYNAAVVHAGVFPGRKLEEQKTRHLLHIQMINPAVNEKSYWTSKAPDESWKFWTNFWDGEERIIFGHSVIDRPLISEKAIGIDGGAVFGLELWALVLPTWEIISVKGEEHYGDRRTASVKIHGDVGAY